MFGVCVWGFFPELRTLCAACRWIHPERSQLFWFGSMTWQTWKVWMGLFCSSISVMASHCEGEERICQRQYRLLFLHQWSKKEPRFVSHVSVYRERKYTQLYVSQIVSFSSPMNRWAANINKNENGSRARDDTACKSNMCNSSCANTLTAADTQPGVTWSLSRSLSHVVERS